MKASSSNLPTRKNKNTYPIMLGILILIGAAICVFTCLCIGVIYFQSKSPSNPFTDTHRPTPDPDSQTWLVMLYLDADDIALEEDILFDLNEAELVGSTDRVTIVAQVDRFDGGFTGDGDWTTARRLYITKDSDLQQLSSTVVQDLGEIPMDDPDTLADFVIWAIGAYPADRYILIMSDHGMGFPGGWTDPDPENNANDVIDLDELEGALEKIVSKTGISRFDLIGMDACLMGMLEVYNALSPYSDYAVASQEVEPSLGWAYSAFLGGLVDTPAMGVDELARDIVDSYLSEDARLLDGTSRRQFLTGYGVQEDISPDDLADQLGSKSTISAIDLAVLPRVNKDLDAFLLALKKVDQEKVAESRTYTQSYTNVFPEQYPSPYIDLLNFASWTAFKIDDPGVKQAAQTLGNSINAMLLAEKHGDQKPGATGISVFFPVSELYWDEEIGYSFYVQKASRMAGSTLWDDFLAYHYAGLDFNQGNPTREMRLPAPGSADIRIFSLELTPDHISVVEPTVHVKAEVTSKRLAYIYVATLMKYQDRYLLYAMDYLLGDSTNVQDGIVYPVWEQENGSKHIDLDYEIMPAGICDGKTCVFALLEPDTYGLTKADVLYSVKGFYIYADTGEQVSARMYFYNDGDNLIRSIEGYYGSRETGVAAGDIIPRPGDKFQFLDTWWEQDDAGRIVETNREGNQLVFGNRPFYWRVVPQPDPGEYYIGIIAEDMDGVQTGQWVPLMITK
ncbi:MAG: hypothetical protein JXA13_01240 [Anaerolineales bacterium]|nr:hypothetical protein [Anaerolineales bacterium]